MTCAVKSLYSPTLCDSTNSTGIQKLLARSSIVYGHQVQYVAKEQNNLDRETAHEKKQFNLKTGIWQLSKNSIALI